ncbi:ABC transporter permease [Acidiluteibacter ferrifornacis]|uniref:FtsX-like permease family protein n=1 Tax=Acidiluteibacter ferrifornacis TaxID=2692424 RepID=A0A6N9NL50_9FLAO|nr:ABC transporter permease [Acidiluteibacter ferrifornacis]NBG66614.1 FtsX-like permease family protein [Acidiluteibacter ferrifornacis]
MNFELFTAKKILQGNSEGNRFSAPIIRISILAIALGMAVMIIALAVVTGFQTEIRNKIVGFGSHISITSYNTDNPLEAKPIDRNQDFYSSIKENPKVDNIQVFANKGGIIKTDEDIYGIVLKGIDKDYDWSFFEDKLVNGTIFSIEDSSKSNSILISEYVANKLFLKVGDDIKIYFIQEPPRIRKFTISGIYNTGFGEMDEVFAICDIRHIQKLNDWSENLVAGFEVSINDFEDLEAVDEEIYHSIGYNFNSTSIKKSRADIFNWLELQDINVFVIIILMLLVAGINIISALLIMVIERTNMIGILKSIGANNLSVRKIFLYSATYLVGVGLFWGNLIGISFCILQSKFEFLKLDQDAYYIDHVPIEISGLDIIGLNIGTLVISVIMLLIPSLIISKISPAKAIKFD